MMEHNPSISNTNMFKEFGPQKLLGKGHKNGLSKDNCFERWPEFQQVRCEKYHAYGPFKKGGRGQLKFSALEYLSDVLR